MTDEFKVEVPVKCDRTGKTVRVPMSLEEAKNFQSLKDKKQEAARYLEASLLDLHRETAPDLAVLYRGTVVVLPTILGGKQETTLVRLLHDLTQRKDLFPVPEKTQRKKSSERRGIREDEPPTPSET